MIENITEYAINKKLFGGGGGKREGTAIPRGVAVDRIYFNTENTIKETNALLSQLTYVQTQLLEHPICAIYANAATEAPYYGSFIIAIKVSDSEYWLAEISNITDALSYNFYNSSYYKWKKTNGWKNLYKTEVAYGDNAICGYMWITSMFVLKELGEMPFTPLTEFMGIPVGAENEKIKNVLSITPF